MMRERIIGLDFIKVIACFWVVALHTVNASFSIVNFVIVSFGVSAIPFFIMVNGYLMFQKKEITYGYIGNKIFRILIVCFSWELLHAFAYFFIITNLEILLEAFCLIFFNKDYSFTFGLWAL